MSVSSYMPKILMDKVPWLRALFAAMLSLKRKTRLDERSHTDLYGSHNSAFAMFKTPEDRQVVRRHLLQGKYDLVMEEIAEHATGKVTVTID